MACSTSLSREGLLLEALSASVNPVWLTGFQPCAGLTHVDAAILAVNATGNAAAQLVVQFATSDVRAPDAPQTVGSPTTSGVHVGADLSSTAATKAFVRFGIAGVLSGGSTVGTVGCSVYLNARQCGGVLGKAEVTLMAGSGAITYLPVGGVHSARAFSEVAAVVRVVGKSGSDLLTRRVYRTFVADREQPSAWSPLESGWDTVSSANAVRFTGAQTPTLTPDSNMWFQLGLALDPAGTDVSCQVQVLAMGAS